MSAIGLADQEARRRIREDLDINFVVEAAAGTGKTTALVERIVAVLKAGVSVREIVAVTFTDPASGELKLRLRKRIEDERHREDCSPEVRARLEDSLTQIEEARIGTIHSFCADLLRERPVEARIDPLFEVAPDEKARSLFERAFDRWFEVHLESPGEGFRRILRKKSGDDGPRGLLRAAAWELASRRDFPAPWTRNEGFNRESLIDGLLVEMASLGEWAADGNAEDYFTKSLAEIKKFADDVRRTESITGGRDYDELEPLIADLTRARNRHWNWKGFRPRPGFPKEELRRRRDELRQRINEFRDASGADLAPLLRNELQEVVDAYEQLKARAGCLDFLDLLLRARDLIRNETVRAYYQQRFSRIFVDEFQDTDPLQAEILLLLAADNPAEGDWQKTRPAPGKLFIVGDPKQSIYRFRRADVLLYEAVKQQVLASGGELLELNVSFRALPEIQEAVNSAFSLSMNGASGSQARYVPLAPSRPSSGVQPAIITLPVPAPYGDYRRVVEWKIEESLPEAVAALVDWLINHSAWNVGNDDPEDRTIKPHHICLLFRRFRSFSVDVTRPYVRALEKRRLPHLLVGGSSFYQREEVEAVFNALSAIERMDDELAVYATLRGPLFGFNDAQLLGYKHRFGGWRPPNEMPADAAEPLKEVADALTVLARLRKGRNHRPASDTISRLLTATRAHAGLALWSSGQQALANMARLMDIARRAESGGVTSFRAFVDYLRDQRERGEASDAPIIEEGAEGVRIMTVHRAKGLEFPIVILADLTAKETPPNPSRWVDAKKELCAFKLAGCLPAELQEHGEEEMRLEQEEAARILYVAATRARDLLIVPALADQRHEGGWLQALHPAIYPDAASARAPITSAPESCPQFGDEAVPARPEDVERPENSVSPGLHKPEAGGHKVVWWDPATLDLDVEDTVDRAKQAFTNSLLAPDADRHRSEEGIRSHAQWQEDRSRVRKEASVPSLAVATATELAQTGLVVGVKPGPAVMVESSGFVGRRPSGTRFGSLVHAVMSLVNLNGSASIRKTALMQAKILGATSEEVDATVLTVEKALAHPIVQRAAAAFVAGKCRRESPVSVLLESGTIAEGVIDLAFEETDDKGRVWTVVDFKTDVEIEGRLEEYKTQVRLYVEAIARATGSRAKGILLRL